MFGHEIRAKWDVTYATEPYSPTRIRSDSLRIDVPLEGIYVRIHHNEQTWRADVGPKRIFR